ncbi:hypothetical protein KSP40_PGU019608 [Platanthera guangdongensis]|uniref:Trichome birefringence-like N-terminal domain-containing protein n=1 Tax=Platanthera guangdongensis TaxID=2320717 RepID=A0ABR2M4N3_9ASPA
MKTRWTKLFACGFMLAFVGCTAFLALNPSGNGSPSSNSLFTSSSFSASISPYRSRFNNLISHYFPNSTSSSIEENPSHGKEIVSGRAGVFPSLTPTISGSIKNQTKEKPSSKKGGSLENNSTNDGTVLQKNGDILIAENRTSIQIPAKNSTGSALSVEKKGIDQTNIKKNETAFKGNEVTSNSENETRTVSQKKATSAPAVPRAELKNQTTAGSPNNLKTEKVHAGSNGTLKEMEDLVKGMVDCDIFHGKWVYDDSYPLYSEGSCPHIDEPFDCFLNGRPDRAYQKLRWQPDGCKIPRFNAIDLLQRLKGKRLAFVGDSLNRNMWESLVCVLWNSVKDKKKVVEVFGRHEFRTEGSYSFLFKDYNCSIQFYRSPFLVQEWEMPDSDGRKKETLRLDIIERSSSGYKDADIIVFNTGHWWTHEKTSKGRDYYQEGNRVYSELNVVEAFHKALHTWALWVDTNVDHKKTLVVFRGYSASHFRGGQWNSGGACDRETEPIRNESFLSPYPPKMRVLETVLNGMKTPVSYLNITRMTDFRKDAHPSVYRKQNLTDEERREPERFQDCSHWCLPGVPDSWNELLYAQILIKQKRTPNW